MKLDTDFRGFPGRPWRHRPPDKNAPTRGWAEWRTHPCAPVVEAMLEERGLDERDVDITRSGPCLAVETVDEVRYFETADFPFDQASEREALGRDMDHAVAWLLRDAMIAATLEVDGGSGTWVTEPTETVSGIVSRAWKTLDTLGAAPPWAITASTPLLDHLARSGNTAGSALRAACAPGPRDPSRRVWHRFAGLLLNLDEGRLHCRSDGKDCHLIDREGLDLIIPDRTLPDTVATAARGLRLSQVISLSGPPPLLADLDPEILGIEEYLDPWWSEQPALRVRLKGGTRTLADVPQPALAVLGINAGSVPRSEKPWFSARLRADGTPRRGTTPAEGR